MKILLMAASFPPPLVGGSVQYLYGIVSQLPPHSFVIYTGEGGSNQARLFDQAFPQRVIRSRFIHHVVERNLKSHEEPLIVRKLTSLWEYFWWITGGLWLILRERPQVIHVGEQNFGAVAAWLGWKLFGIPYLFYTYAEELSTITKRRLHRAIFQTALRDAQAVVTVADYTRHLLMDMGVLPERIFKVVPAVGHEKKLAVTPAQIEEVRRKYHLEGRKVLLTVGGLAPRKGHQTVIQALAQIARHYPEVCYVVAGIGPQQQMLEQQVAAAGLEGRVIFAGRVDDGELNCLYEICDIFVMPHRQLADSLDTEGCPTVFLEAGAHGKPVIGGNAGGVADAILQERTGFIIDGTDAAALAQTIVRLLDHPELAHRLGENGRQYASSLTPERNAAEIWRLSERLAKSNGIVQI